MLCLWWLRHSSQAAARASQPAHRPSQLRLSKVLLLLSMSSLIFFGQGGEMFMGEDGAAEERIKSLLGDSGTDRNGLVRRRIVRRPLSGYQAQPMVFSEVRGAMGRSPPAPPSSHGA